MTLNGVQDYQKVGLVTDMVLIRLVTEGGHIHLHHCSSTIIGAMELKRHQQLDHVQCVILRCSDFHHIFMFLEHRGV